MPNNIKFMDGFYQEKIAENEMHLMYWEDYLNNLKSLNFESYTEKLTVPILVPIGHKIYFRGELKHTNEISVALGTEYFVKCSAAQAEILRQHRIKDIQTKVELYRKEKDHLDSHVTFTKQNLFNTEGQEILEVYSEEEDKVWRQKHKENVRKYKQDQAKQEKIAQDETTEEDLWERLEELELQEELENEMLNNYNEITDMRKHNTFLTNEENLLHNSFKLNEDIQNKHQDNKDTKNVLQKEYKEEKKANKNNIEITETDKVQVQSSQQDLLQKVLDKQHELENKLHELKYKEREQSKTEQDLITKLDEMEQLDELEDEIERLDDILQTDDLESDEELSNADSNKLKKSIFFADNDESDTIEINFKHSETEPKDIPYIPETGITKPSDLYEAYSSLFNHKRTSILKKSKYGPECLKEEEDKQTRKVNFKETSKIYASPEPEENSEERTIVIKDIVEAVGVNQHKIEGGARPTSLFKRKRMENKA